ncbi:MAG: hypothetical protein JNK38_27935 [Acidobacteria bacterium]|nr:hypothetical protein [Acidobacteriota bacterium]
MPIVIVQIRADSRIFATERFAISPNGCKLRAALSQPKNQNTWEFVTENVPDTFDSMAFKTGLLFCFSACDCSVGGLENFCRTTGWFASIQFSRTNGVF